MIKYFTILFFNAVIFLYGSESIIVKDLTLLNNPLLNSGNYKDGSLYKIYNLTFGREFSLDNNIDTSLYLSYSKIDNKDKYYSIKSSIGFHDTMNKNTIYGFGISTLFLKNHKISNETTLYAKIKYHVKSSYNPYIKFQLNYNIFKLPSGYKASNGLEASIDSGFDIDILKSYAGLPFTISPYIQARFYDTRLKKELGFSQLYTIGLGVDYNIGEYLRKKSPLHSTKIKFSMQKTFSDKEFSGYNFSVKLSLFDF